MIERDQPLPYGRAYLLLTASFLALIALWMISSVTLLPAIMMVVTTTVFVFASMRGYSTAGVMIPLTGCAGNSLMWTVLPQHPAAVTMEWEVATSSIRQPFGSSAGIKGPGTSLAHCLSSMRMASLAGVSKGNVVKVVILAAIIAPFLSQIGFWWTTQFYGLSKMPAFGSSFITGWGNPDQTMTDPALEPWIPHAAAGFIACIGLYYLHARFVWFPFEPLGLILATSDWALVAGLWTMFFVAWLAKTLTMRIGGSKAYEQIGVPVAAGFVAGFVIIEWVGGIMLMYKFFFPF